MMTWLAEHTCDPCSVQATDHTLHFIIFFFHESCDLLKHNEEGALQLQVHRYSTQKTICLSIHLSGVENMWKWYTISAS